jgi:hypothetical protein
MYTVIANNINNPLISNKTYDQDNALIPKQLSENTSNFFSSFLITKFRIASIIRNERIDPAAFQKPESVIEKDGKIRKLVNTYIYDIQPSLGKILINLNSFSTSLNDYAPILQTAAANFSPKGSSKFKKYVTRLLTDIANYKQNAEESINSLLTHQSSLKSAIIELTNEFKNRKEPEPIDESKNKDAHKIKDLKNKLIALSDTIDESNKKLLKAIPSFPSLGKLEVLDGTVSSALFSDTKANVVNPYETLYAQSLVGYKNDYDNYATQLSEIDPIIAAITIYEDLATRLNASLLILIAHTKDMKNEVFSEIEQGLHKLLDFNLEEDRLKVQAMIGSANEFFNGFSETTKQLIDNMTIEIPKDTKETDLLDMSMLLK